jgi:small subunit ribosomal protein S4
MSKNLGPVCRICRREGEKLYLKGERCFTPKCAIDRRSFPPGQHGRTGSHRGGNRRVYGVLERQFRRYFEIANQRHGLTGLTLLQILESRLDNVVYRLGFAANRAQARLMVTHGHFMVNGRRTDVPSMLLKEGDVIAVRDGSRSLTYFKELGDLADARTSPSWLNRDTRQLSGSIQRLPERAEIDGFLNEQSIVEYYSR